MKPLVIYHALCADGYSAAWCFHHKNPNGYEFFPGIYNKNPPDCSGRDVYLVDFSYKKAKVETILEECKSLTLIDHHKSAMDELLPHELSASDKLVQGDSRWSKFTSFCDLNRSGATLAWDFLFPDASRPLLLGHIEDRDLWRFKLPGTREIQANVFSYPYTFEYWDKLMAADQTELLKMTVAGAAIERKHHKDIAELLEVCQRPMLIGGVSVMVASLPYTMVSDAAGAMAKGKPFAGTYWDTLDTRVFGLRSDDDGMDVAEIAKQYGGGGHVHSSGFNVPRNHPLAQA